MRYFILMAMLASCIAVSSQTDWKKTDRENLFNEYLGVLGKYKKLSKEQQESISLCALELVTTKYKKAEFSSKIEIELKRIHESQIAQCAKNIGIELDQSVNAETEIKTVEPKPTDEWTREDKEKMSNDFFKFLNEYPSLDDFQREAMSLCYINETTAKFTKPQYNAMIAIELKQHKSAVLTRCAKSQKISLDAPKVAEVTKPMSVNIVGSWKTDRGSVIKFTENNRFEEQYDRQFSTHNYFALKDAFISGDWFMDEKNMVTVNSNWVEVEYKMFNRTDNHGYKTTGVFRIVSCTDTYMKIEVIEGALGASELNGKPNAIIQCNRIKIK